MKRNFMFSALLALAASAALTLGAPPAGAAATTDVVANTQSEALFLHDSACPASIAQLFDGVTIVANAKDALHAATHVNKNTGKTTAGCWLTLPEDAAPVPAVFLRYEDGDYAVLPLSAFKPVSSI